MQDVYIGSDGNTWTRGKIGIMWRSGGISLGQEWVRVAGRDSRWLVSSWFDGRFSLSTETNTDWLAQIESAWAALKGT